MNKTKLSYSKRKGHRNEEVEIIEVGKVQSQIARNKVRNNGLNLYKEWHQKFCFSISKWMREKGH